MKTNYLLSLLIVFSFFALTSFSVSTNSISKKKKTESIIEKDTFNVMASHGIFLRDSANLTCNKLAKLPYATKLVFLNQDTISEEITIQETKYFELKGRMQKVKVISQIDSLNNLEGYVFDGYLTRFPVPKLDYDGTVGNEIIYDELHYLRTHFKEHERYNVKKHNFCDMYCTCSFEQRFGENKEIAYSMNQCQETGGNWQLTTPYLSLTEAYFFSFIWYYRPFEGKYYVKATFDILLNSIRLEPKDYTNKNDYVIIKSNKERGVTIFVNSE